jgi:hypothetical protein
LDLLRGSGAGVLVDQLRERPVSARPESRRADREGEVARRSARAPRNGAPASPLRLRLCATRTGWSAGIWSTAAQKAAADRRPR